MKVIITGMIGNLKSISGYPGRPLNTYWTSEHHKARHSEAAHQLQSFFNNTQTSAGNYIRSIGSRLPLFYCGRFILVLESLANKAFNHVVRLFVARSYDVYGRLPLTEENWKFELRGFIENYEFPCVGAWDSFHVLCISKLKQFYKLKKRYAVTNLELVGSNFFWIKSIALIFWLKIFLMKENIPL